MRNFTSRLYNEAPMSKKVGAGGRFDIFLDSVVNNTYVPHPNPNIFSSNFDKSESRPHRKLWDMHLLF